MEASNFDHNKISSLMRSNRRNELKHIQLAFEHWKGILFIIPLENYLITCWKIDYIVQYASFGHYIVNNKTVI